MSAVEIASTGWGTLLRPTGPAGSLVPVVGASCQINILGGGSATIWSDNTRTASLTQPLTTRADGTLPGFIDLGTYTGTWTIPGQAPFSHQLDMAGPTGAPGPPGVGASWQGVWSNATTYTLNQGVSRNGLPYISNANSNLNHDPATDAVNWTAINPVDGLATVGTMRTLGSGAQQATAGNDPRIISVDEYFIAGDADDAASIQRAAAALPASGGKLRFRQRSYACATVPFSFDATSGVTLEGVGGRAAGGGLAGTAGAGTAITYTGSAARFISARNSQAFTIRGIALYYTNAAFTGNLVDFSSALGTPATNMRLDDVSLESGGASPHTATLLNLDNAIDGNFTSCLFMQANIGVYGRSSNTNFSNTHTFTNCLFQGQATVHIKNVNQAWTFNGCIWEPLQNGKAGSFSHDVGVTGRCVVINGGYMADTTTGGGSWITWAGEGLVLSGITLGLEQTGTIGVTIDGTCNGIAVTGCTFGTVTSATAFAWGTTTGHSNIVRLGNAYLSGVTVDSGTKPSGLFDQSATGVVNILTAGDNSLSLTSNATNVPRLTLGMVNTGTTPFASLQISDTAAFRTFQVNPSGGHVQLGSGGVFGIGLNGNVPVVKAAAIASPTAPSAGYVQAEAQAMKTAVDAIRVALTNIGITG